MENEEMEMRIRRYDQTDCEEITALFYETVHSINAKDYTKEQLDVWAKKDVDIPMWNQSFLSHYTLVAAEEAKIIGFGDMDPSGYLDRLYVHKDYQGRGVATALCDALESWAFLKCRAKKVTTHASVTARPFFEMRGYLVIREQQVERSGIFLKNFVMEKKRSRAG